MGIPPEPGLPLPSQEPEPSALSSPPPAPQRGWKPVDLLLFIGIAAAAFIGANLIAVLAYVGMQVALDVHISTQNLQKDPLFAMALQLLIYSLLLLGLYAQVVFGQHRPFLEALKWRPSTGLAKFEFLFSGMLLAIAVQFMPAFLPETKTFPLEEYFTSASAAYAAGAFAIIVAPFVEEVVFRGVLFGIFETSLGLTAAIILSALLFAGLHVAEYWGAWHHLLMICIVAFVLSLARGLTGSFATSYFLHLAYNSTIMALLYLQTDHFRQIHGLTGH
jgi:CAAX protease family protein